MIKSFFKGGGLSPAKPSGNYAYGPHLYCAVPCCWSMRRRANALMCVTLTSCWWWTYLSCRRSQDRHQVLRPAHQRQSVHMLRVRLRSDLRHQPLQRRAMREDRRVRRSACLSCLSVDINTCACCLLLLFWHAPLGGGWVA